MPEGVKSTNSQVRMVESLQKRVREQGEMVLEKQEAVKTSINEKASALLELTKHVTNFKKTVERLRNPIINSYSKFTPEFHTTETDKGESYADISTKNNFKKTDFTFSVLQRARQASFMLALNAGGTEGIDIVDDAGLNGTITLEIDDGISLFPDEINIDIVNIDKAADIVAKINERLEQEGQSSYKALLITNPGNNTAYIEIRGEMGDLRTINFNWAPNASDNDLFAFNNIVAQGAEILFDGVKLESATNEFKEVLSGMDLKVKKANQLITPEVGTPYYLEQSVTFVDDGVPFGQDLGATIDSYNTLANFVYEQKQASEDEKLPLFSNPELIKAEALLTAFASASNSSSLSQLGLQVDTSGARLLQLKDQSKLQEAAKDLSFIKKILMNSDKITTNAANQGSFLAVTAMNKRLPLSLAGKDFEMVVNVDAGSVVTDSSATVDGVLYNVPVANIKDQGDGKYYLEFDAASPLAGVSFYYNVKDAVNHDEKFTVNLTNGIADNAYNESQKMLDDFGGGSLISELKKMNELEKKAAEKYQQMEEKHQKEVEKAREVLSRIEMIFMQSEMWQENIGQLFGLGA